MKMDDKTSKRYISFLERRIKTLSSSGYADDLESLLRIQNELVIQRYGDRDYLISQNKQLMDRITSLERTVAFNNEYIHFLVNSKWWKMSLPLRFPSRIKAKRKFEKGQLDFRINCETKNAKPLDCKVLVLLSTYSPGEEFSVQLDKLLSQKLIKNLEIIVVDYGSVDNTIQLAQSRHVKVLNPYDITKDRACFEASLPEAYDYVIYLEQNKIIDDDFWIFKAIKPIEDNQASATIIFDPSQKEMVEKVKLESYFYELRKRFQLFSDHYFLYLPPNRDNVQFLDPSVLDKSAVVVRKLK